MANLLKEILKKGLYQSGALSFYHKVKNRNTLTVLMFHRVMREEDPLWESVDPEWTVSDVFFKQTLVFISRHYNVISCSDLIEAQKTGTALPPRSLIITFDDGWQDNETYAMKIIEDHKMPGIVFLVSELVDTLNVVWQTVLYGLMKSGNITHEILSNIWNQTGLDQSEFLYDWKTEEGRRAIESKLNQLPELEQRKISQIINQAGKEYSSNGYMLNSQQIRNFLKSKMNDVGSHGATHIPIPYSNSPKEELKSSFEAVMNYRGSDNNIVLAFPHSIWNQSCLKQAVATGYQLLMGGMSCLTPTKEIGNDTLLLGRMNVHQPMLSDGRGRLRKELMAIYLFFKPIRKYTYKDKNPQLDD